MQVLIFAKKTCIIGFPVIAKIDHKGNKSLIIYAMLFNSLRPRQNERYNTDDTSKCIFERKCLNSD